MLLLYCSNSRAKDGQRYFSFLDHNASVLYQVLVSVNSGRQVGPMETAPKSRKKGQPREMNLTAQCLICNGPAAAHQVSLCFLFEEDWYACLNPDDYCAFASLYSNANA